MQDYHKLLVWKKSFEFVKSVYTLSSSFPKEEIFGLTSQLRRAAVSVVANIAEGRGKPTDNDFLKFLFISNGSLNECQCYFELALELNFITKAQFDLIDNKCKEVSFLLHRMIKSIKLPKPL